MVTLNKIGGGTADNGAVFYGKSSDTKPTSMSDTSKIPNGSAYVEIDTGNVYFYDLDTDDWILPT